MKKNHKLINLFVSIALMLLIGIGGGCIAPQSTITVITPSTVINTTTSTVTTGIPSVVPYTVTTTLPQPAPATVTSIVPSSVPYTVTNTVPVTVPYTVTSTVPYTIPYTPPYTPPPSSQLFSIALTPQSAFIPTGVFQTLVATLYDQNNNPVPNRTLNWTIFSGPGVFTSAQSVTDITGRAQAVVTSTVSGTTQVQVSPLANPAIFATAYQVWVSAMSSVRLTLNPAIASSAVGTDYLFTASVTDQNGFPVYGTGVVWDIIGGPGSIVSAQSVTDYNGQALAVINSSFSGTTTLLASLSSNPSIYDTSTMSWNQMTTPIITLSPGTGTNSVGTNRTLTATVVNQFGNRMQGVAVTWNIQSGPGSFLATQTITDVNGQAQAVITSPTAGTTVARAAVGIFAGFDTATITWVGITSSSLSLTPAIATNNTGSNRTMTATVRDQFGNPVPGVTIAWSIQSGPGSIVTMQTITNASGQAQAVLTSNTTGNTVIRAAVTSPVLSDTSTISWIISSGDD